MPFIKLCCIIVDSFICKDKFFSLFRIIFSLLHHLNSNKIIIDIILYFIVNYRKYLLDNTKFILFFLNIKNYLNNCRHFLITNPNLISLF